ncbi:Initiation factor 2B-related, partial [Dillenia turbinata]
SAIRDLVVRDAPAIAIAAALSLAVEVPENAKTVFQAYIDAAEIMLQDDVASNKAIGSFGASFLRDHLKASQLLYTLLYHAKCCTCCSCGVATAGYGTALGFIRSLYAAGVLEKAYCTETRPFNQLVHDKIPTTLIADSAAVALMNAGCVNAVIVGADRVAANGVTANKIGTYSLALAANHHGIPFYVAAPLTSIDLLLPSGQEIVIEERSPKELLNTRGGLGEQVAASGIPVWNPAFDVTPAKLIAAIITEKVSLSLSLSHGYDNVSRVLD